MNKDNIFFGKITEVFIKNKQLAVLTVIAILFWGSLSFLVMPKQYNPKITAPAFIVTTQFEGASSEEVYELVTRPMENKIREIPEVDKVMSRSIDGGKSIVTVQFFIGEDVESAKISLIQKLESNMEFKPLQASSPNIKEINPEDVPVVVLALTSDSFSDYSLRKIAWDIGDKIKTVGDISKIEVSGGRKMNLIVDLDESKLRATDISIDQVLSVIQENNIRKKVGHIDSSEFNLNVVIDGNIKDIDDLNRLVIRSNEGKEVYLSDIGSVYYGEGKTDNSVGFVNKNIDRAAVFLAFSKKEGSNATTVSKEVLEKVKEIKNSSNFAEVDIETVRNNGRVAAESVFGLTLNLLMAIMIVSLVLLFFLGWSSALVVSLSIPLSLALVFGVGNIFGQTINRITLFALILSLGLLVDNATVIVENIYRFLEKNKKKNKKSLIVKAVDEVAPGLAMSTLTTIFAFVPMAFVTGMMGPYMGPIPFFVPAALIASFLVSMTINPFMVDLFTKIKKTNSRNSKNYFMKVMQKIRNIYTDALKKIIESARLRKNILISVSVLFVLAMALPAFGVVKFRMLPKDDKEQFYIYVDLPSTFTFEKTHSATKDLEGLIIKNNEVRSIQSFVGEPAVVDFNGLFKASSNRINENQATLRINLTHPKERKDTSEDIVLELRYSLKEFISKNPSMKIKFIEDPPGPPVLSTFLVKVQGENKEVLKKIIRDIENISSQTKGVVDIDDNIEERGIEYVFEVNKEKASQVSISTEDIISSVSAVFGEKKVGLYHQNEDDQLRKPEQEFIVVSFVKENNDQPADINNIFISNNLGEKIPLSELIYRKKSDILPMIYSDNFEKTYYVSAEMKERSVVYAVLDLFGPLLEYRLPEGNGVLESWSLFGITYRDKDTGEKYRILFDGEWKLTLEVFRDLGIAMAVAIFIIYFLLVFQFKSLKAPLLIMATIPLAMIGVMPGFAILGASKGIFFNATSMIGVIALSGIVVNNAIIFLEYIKKMKIDNFSIKEALLKAGETRFLPIILTSVTTILGSLTIVSDPVWAGLAWAIIWGLSTSTFLTLIVFPIFYYMAEEKNWRKNN
jgi:multidrug efflux pump subunit AcrB